VKYCAECGQRVYASKPGPSWLAQEHFDVATGATTYRCRACTDRLVERTVGHTVRWLRS